MWALCKKEFRQFFSNLTGYLVIGLFLLLNGLLLFALSSFNILDFGYASLDNFFLLAPFVLLILIPSVTMRQISEEYKSGTMEILQTSPLSNRQIVLGKYLAALLVTTIALLPTLTYALSIKALATTETILDTGAWIGAYTGLILLCAVFCALSLLAGSFTQNPVVALLTGASLCFLLFKGMSAISSLSFLANGPDFYLQKAGLEYHYQSVSRGVLNLSDLIYFFTLIAVFIYLTERRIGKNQASG